MTVFSVRIDCSNLLMIPQLLLSKHTSANSEDRSLVVLPSISSIETIFVSGALWLEEDVCLFQIQPVHPFIRDMEGQ